MGVAPKESMSCLRWKIAIRWRPPTYWASGMRLMRHGRLGSNPKTRSSWSGFFFTRAQHASGQGIRPIETGGAADEAPIDWRRGLKPHFLSREHSISALLPDFFGQNKSRP